MWKERARQLSASAVLLVLSFGLVESSLCPRQGCRASQQNEIEDASSNGVFLPERAVASDFHISVQFVQFVNTTTPGPKGSQLAGSVVLSFHIDQELLKPVTVQLNVSSFSDRRALSQQPFVHWWRRAERSWKPLCPTAYDADSKLVSAEVPAAILNLDDFATEASPALCGAFYIDDGTWTCLTERGVEDVNEPEGVEETGSKGWDWGNLNTWQILVIVSVSLVVGLVLGAVFLCSWLCSWRRAVPPEPPKDTPAPNLFPRPEESDLEITHSPMEHLTPPRQHNLFLTPPRQHNLFLPQHPRPEVDAQEHPYLKGTLPQNPMCGVITDPVLQSQTRPLTVSESPGARQIHFAPPGDDPLAIAADIPYQLPADDPPPTGARQPHDAVREDSPHGVGVYPVPSALEQRKLFEVGTLPQAGVKDAERTPNPISIPEELVAGHYDV